MNRASLETGKYSRDWQVCFSIEEKQNPDILPKKLYEIPYVKQYVCFVLLWAFFYLGFVSEEKI